MVIRADWISDAKFEADPAEVTASSLTTPVKSAKLG